VKADQVKAAGLNLDGLPVAVEGKREPVGELDGLLIDLSERRVRYLVVEASHTHRRHLLPLDATALDVREGHLERVSADDAAEWPVFDPSAVQQYDDDAMMSLMFGSPAA
jgi:hypothetical protein